MLKERKNCRTTIRLSIALSLTVNAVNFMTNPINSSEDKDPAWFENFFVVEGFILIFSSVCLIAYSHIPVINSTQPSLLALFLKEMGFAGFVAFFLNMSIEWVNRRRHEKFVHSLSRDIFKTVYGRNIDKKIIDQIEKNVLKCDTYRKNYLVEVRLEVWRDKPNFVKFCFYNSYDVVNIGSEKSKIPIIKAQIDLNDPDADRLEQVKIDEEIYPIEKISVSENGFMTINLESELERNQVKKVCLTYVKHMPIDSSEAIITTFPMDGMRLVVSDPYEKFEIGAISLHPENALADNLNEDRNDYKKWVLDCGVTPGQGMMLFWKPKKVSVGNASMNY